MAIHEVHQDASSGDIQGGLVTTYVLKLWNEHEFQYIEVLDTQKAFAAPDHMERLIMGIMHKPPMQYVTRIVTR